MISVLIPIYNTAKFLPQCLNSLKQQTYTDWEAILVNDASPDNAYAICEAYASQDSRFKILHKKRNEGVEKARWDGLRLSQGEYITFLDSDDWLEKGALEAMMSHMNQFHCDYVGLNFCRCIDKHKLFKKKGYSYTVGHILQPQLQNSFYISFFGVNKLSVSLCGKLYQAQFIKRFMPQPLGICMGEDLYSNLMMHPHLNNIYISDYIGYNYRFGGMTSVYNPHLFQDWQKLYHIRRRCLEEYPIEQGRRFLDIEAKNILRSEIEQLILYKGYGEDPSELLTILNKYLEDPTWDEISKTLANEKNYGPFSRAIINKDTSQLINIAQKRIKNIKLKRYTKRLIYSILNHLP
jgi:glycosyltransferase involved in cell wall biosynthesis